MTDDQIVEYLRSRAGAQPPMDLVGSIVDAIEAEPQRRRSWFTPFVPAAAAVAAAAAVLVAALLVGQGPRVGPPPASSPTAAVTSGPTASPAPSPTPVPTLLVPGDEVTLDATDTDGRWGSVTLTRGEDVGGYDDGSVPPESFVIEVNVEYLAEREPTPLEFGAPDWTLVGADGQPVGDVVASGGRHEIARPALSSYPGAIDIFTNPLQGWLLFQVPRAAEGEALQLVYQPSGLAEPVVVMALREPGPAPDAVAVVDPQPPEPVTYVERSEYPFSVIDSAEADALFDVPDSCENPAADGAWTVTYPDAWFSNTEIGVWPACSWFSPTFYAVGDDPDAVPPQIAFVGQYMEGDSGSFEERLLTEPLTVGGNPAVRFEERGAQGQGGTMPPEWHSYGYQIQLGGTPEGGPNIVFRTTTDMGGDYNLNKAVLDRIMALIDLPE